MNESVAFATGDAVLNRVFHKRLDRKHRNFRGKHRFIDLEFRAQFRTKTQLLDFKIRTHDANFFRKRREPRR